MYAKTHKEKFLNNFENEDTKKVYESVFRKTESFENAVGYDFMDFNLEMFDKFVKEHMKPKTRQSARTYGHILSSYIQWSIDNKYSKNEVNPIQDGSSYFESFVQKQDSLYISKNEIDAIVFSLVNAQDAFIIKALFEGIQGKKLFELINLKKEDIYNAEKTGLLNLVNSDGSKRDIEVEEDTLKLAKIAMNENEYYKKNGELDYSDNVKDRLDLVDSEYVLRPSLTNNGKKMLTHYSVYNRLEMIKELEEFYEYKDSLTTKNIIRSGMIYEAKKYMDNGYSLNLETIEKICKKYNMKYKWSLKDFLNENTVNEVYSS